MENNRPHKSFPQTPFCVSAAPSPSMIRSHAPLSGQRLRTNRIGSTVPGANGFCSEEEFTGICSQDCPRIEHKTPSICFLSFSHLRIKNLPVTATLLEGSAVFELTAAVLRHCAGQKVSAVLCLCYTNFPSPWKYRVTHTHNTFPPVTAWPDTEWVSSRDKKVEITKDKTLKPWGNLQPRLVSHWDCLLPKVFFFLFFFPYWFFIYFFI